jgi:hypothetical protein
MQKQMPQSKKQLPFILPDFLQLFLCIAFISVISCKKDDGKTNDPFVTCCTYDATTYTDGDRKYAIPTLVTDNMDGTNDVFVILTNVVTGNDTIVSLRIFDDQNVLIFELSMKEIENEPFVWDGQIASGPNIGARYRGAFSYEFIIRGPSGPAININGKACIVADYCEVKEENFDKCVLATQHTGGGEFNSDLPSLEGCQ